MDEVGKCMDPSVFCYAFVDESGTVGVKNGTHFFVVALLGVDQSRTLELPVRRALKKYGRRLSSGELKASRLDEAVVIRMLQEVSKQDVWVAAAIVDQQAIKDPLEDAEDIYRVAVTRAIYCLVERFPMADISLDRRYTNEKLRFELEKHIREGIQDLPQKVVLIRQENSYIRKELQAADAVAWAFFQKYERNDTRFYDMIASKIAIEEIIWEIE